MGKPKGKVKIEWSPEFAYAIGLIVTDGSLSKSGRHIDFTSKDLQLVETFQQCLGTTLKVSKKSSGTVRKKKYYRVQIGDVLFYRFLESIGMSTNKSKTITVVDVPDRFFFDFLRGHFDGDGCFYSYWDKRWKSSFMYYLVFNSASLQHIEWLQRQVDRLAGVSGHISKSGRPKSTLYALKFAKSDTGILLKKMYYKDDLPCLKRKYLKIFDTFATLQRAR